MDEARAALLSAIEKSTKRREREREELADALQNAARAEEWQQAGDLLLASPQAFTAGRDTVTVSDWYGQVDNSGNVPIRTLTVDPALTWKENAERFFARARKARAALSTLAARRDAAMDELLRLSAAREQAQTAPHIEGIKTARGIGGRITGEGAWPGSRYHASRKSVWGASYPSVCIARRLGHLGGRRRRRQRFSDRQARSAQ